MQVKFKTTSNLAKTFLMKTESSALLRLYATTAKKSGFESVSELFKRLIDVENEHAKLIYDFLNDNLLKEAQDSSVSKSITVYKELLVNFADTTSNVTNIINIKNKSLLFFQEFAEIAELEDFLNISKTFNNLAIVEKNQIQELEKIRQRLEDNTMFVSEEACDWYCNKCAYVHRSIQAPEICPLCKQAKANFSRLL